MPVNVAAARGLGLHALRVPLRGGLGRELAEEFELPAHRQPLKSPGVRRPARALLRPTFPQARSRFRRLVRRLEQEYAYASLLATDCIGTRYEVRREQVSVLDSRWNERGCVARVHDGTGYREASFNRPLSAGGGAAAPGGDRRRRGQDGVPRAPRAAPAPPLAFQRAAAAGGGGRGANPRPPAELARPGLRPAPACWRTCAWCSRWSPFASCSCPGAASWSRPTSGRRASMVPVVRRGEDTRYVHEAFSGLKGAELLDEMEGKLEQAVALADELLSAGRVTPGMLRGDPLAGSRGPAGPRGLRARRGGGPVREGPGARPPAISGARVASGAGDPARRGARRPAGGLLLVRRRGDPGRGHGDRGEGHHARRHLRPAVGPRAGHRADRARAAGVLRAQGLRPHGQHLLRRRARTAWRT